MEAAPLNVKSNSPAVEAVSVPNPVNTTNAENTLIFFILINSQTKTDKTRQSRFRIKVNSIKLD